MSPGQLLRRLLGPKLFEPLGRASSAAFVDLEQVAESFPPLPRYARVLHLGGGDGQLLNALLARFADARATMIDVAPQLGGALSSSLLARVDLLPNTSVRDYAARGRPPPDLIVICDLVHHVPPQERVRFFSELRALFGPNTALLVKDVRPGKARAYLSYWVDRYLLGDPWVSLIGEDALEALVQQALPGLVAERTPLFERHPPHYAIVFRR